MGYSKDELRSAGDRFPPTCSVGILFTSRYPSMSVMRMPSGLNSFLWNESRNIFASVNVGKPGTAFGSLLNRCFSVTEHIVGSGKVRWFWKRQQSVPPNTVSVGVNPEKPTTTWDSLPTDLRANALQTVDFRDLFRLKRLSDSWKKLVESEAFGQSRVGISAGEFTAINYYIRNNIWRSSGNNLHSKSWMSLPSLSYLPPPDAELFKEYSACGHGGLMCAEVSKLPKKGQLVVFNPLTGKTRALPPLLHPRNPVLVHILVDSAKNSYKVIVAGSAAASDEHISRKVEVFDSLTSKWKELCDLPGPAFGLNEHQAGVFLNGKLFLISFLKSGGRGVVALDVESGTWLPDLTTPIPWSSYSTTLQLVESDENLFVFSEQEQDQSVYRCIDELEFQNPKAGVLTCRWRSFVKVKKSGGLQMSPERSCDGFRAGKLGIFSPLSRKLLNILLASCTFAIMPHRAFAEDPLGGVRDPSYAWGSPDYAKKAAGTLLVGVAMIVAGVACRMCRRRQAPDHPFDIDGGLEASDTPAMDNPVYNILPRLLPA